MKTILEHITELPRNTWDYYLGIDSNNKLKNPFSENITHRNFIRQYFKRGGKTKVLKDIGVNIDKLRYPNHINSVFFLGLLVYNNTDMNQKYVLGKNIPGYNTFPFIWFLTTLFHDHAYQIEGNKRLVKRNNSLKKLIENYNVEHHLLENDFRDFPKDLIDSCANYFEYRVKVWEKIDHGIFAGIILYDRLVKIRRSNYKSWDETLFWGEELEEQYKLAAIAIATHNIWLPAKDTYETYRTNGLEKLITFKPIKFEDFQLLYILGIIDTMDPIKTFQEDGFSDIEILDNLIMEFNPNSIVFAIKKRSKLNFKKLIDKAVNFEGWLDVDIKSTNCRLEINFK